MKSEDRQDQSMVIKVRTVVVVVVVPDWEGAPGNLSGGGDMLS